MARTGELYIFGDSLSDDGATAVQTGQEPVPFPFGGRATTGLIWHEYIRNDLAVSPAAATISQAPNLAGFLSGSELNGVNFAHGGAVASEDDRPSRPGGLQQADGFAALVEAGAIPSPDDQDVFAIWIGGNDFLRLADASFSDILDIVNLGSSIVESIEQTVETLAAVGAQNFLIIGLPKAGGAFLGALSEENPVIKPIWNRLVENYNERLEDYVQSIDENPDRNALFIDIAALIDDVEDDPALYGFSNVSSDIFTDDAPVDDQTYFSVDGIHPTSAGHAVIADYIVETAAAANFDLTALAGNVLPGSERDDMLLGTGGNDSLTGGAGDDTLIGQDGVDTAFFDAAITQYTLSIGQSITLEDRSGAEGTDTLSGIEFLDFQGERLELSMFDDAVALPNDAFRTLTEVYLSYFDRAPDALGLTYWADAFATGLTLSEIVGFFATSDEAREVLPQDLSSADFVNTVYTNTLGRAPDNAGFEFWSSALESGFVSREQFILEVLQGARAEPPADASAEFTAQQEADQSYLDSKVDIGIYFSAILGLSNVENASDVMALYDGSEASIAQAITAATQAAETASLADGAAEFLVELVGVVEDPFLIG